jgi:4-hydroxybenzoate polyprenyltransferase
MAGKAFLKRKLSLYGTLEVETLPYREDLLELLRAESSAGRRLILVSGADHSIARRVADHLNLFDDVLGSDGENNLVGTQKIRAIQALLGPQRFIYAGNSRDDFPVWMSASGAIVVNAPRSFPTKLERQGKSVVRIFPGRSRSWRPIVKSIRLHQWSKNALIFVPLLLSHKIFDLALDLKGLLGFLAFSLAASSLYVVNDLLDIQADRRHPRKRKRPFAAGELSIPAGFVLAAFLVCASAILSLWLSWPARLLIGGYCVTSLAYSLFLKRHLFIDVVLLASFFTLRLVFGGVATGIKISIWTLAFSMFLFLSLALMKRLTELRLVLSPEKPALAGRGYVAADLPLISSLSAASGLLSVLVLALYLQSSEVHTIYSRSYLLWLMCPLLLYWLGRFAILANRGYIHDDPVVFAFTDRASLVVGLLALGVMLCAI